MLVSTFLQTTFQTDYPKLLHLFHTFFSRVSSLGTAQGSEAHPANEWLVLKKALTHIENAYLQRSLSKMFDPINTSFSGGGKPLSQNAAGNILRIFASELEVASFDHNLVKSAARLVAKSLSLLCVSSEKLVASDSNGFFITDFSTLSHAQALNIDIANSVFVVYDGVWKLMEGQPADVLAVAADSLRTAQQLIASIVEPLFFGMVESLEGVLIKIHQEDYSVLALAAQQLSPLACFFRPLPTFLAPASRLSSVKLLICSAPHF